MINRIPEGILIPIGGREDKEESKEVLSRVIAETGKADPHICLSGGKQLELSTLMGGTKLLALIKQRYYDECLIR